MVSDPLGTTVTSMKHTPAKLLTPPSPPSAGSSFQQLFPTHLSRKNSDSYSKDRCPRPTKGRKGMNLDHYVITMILIMSVLSRVEVQCSKLSKFPLTHLYHPSQSDYSTHYFSNISTEVKTSVMEYLTHIEHCKDYNINRWFLF